MKRFKGKLKPNPKPSPIFIVKGNFAGLLGKVHYKSEDFKQFVITVEGENGFYLADKEEIASGK